jgi:putative RecB family exonuclease
MNHTYRKPPLPEPDATPGPSKRVYSHSRLSNFENCPKAFHYRYILEIPAEKEGVEAFMGKVVHNVLERLFLHVGKGHLPSFEAIRKRYHEDWEEAFAPESIRIVRTEKTADFYRDTGERCLRNFYERHTPFNRSETLGLEEKIFFDLDETGEVQIQGFVDRVSRTADGVIEIEDYKTGKRVPSQRDVDFDRQLALYEIGIREKFQVDGPVRLVWHYVQNDKTRISRRSPQQLKQLRKSTLQLTQRIEAEQEFRPHTSPLCNWCDYKERCPAQGGRDV